MSDNFHPSQVRLCLVHERALFRESLARLLAAEPDFALIDECATPAGALESLARSSVDVVLLDLGDEGAMDFMAAARKVGYDSKFLIVTSTVDATSSAQALKLGASGIFLEFNSSARLIQAIRLVANGESWLDHSLIQMLAGRYPAFEDPRLRIENLTCRQQTVIEGVVDGLSNRKIADRLGMSEGTVKSTLQQLFNKVGVRTRSQLVSAALRGGLSDNIEKANTEQFHG
jgi:two-component system, NarL family, nitrate/nitrite response regulator NarL